MSARSGGDINVGCRQTHQQIHAGALARRLCLHWT